MNLHSIGRNLSKTVKKEKQNKKSKVDDKKRKNSSAQRSPSLNKEPNDEANCDIDEDAVDNDTSNLSARRPTTSIQVSKDHQYRTVVEKNGKWNHEIPEFCILGKRQSSC